MIILRESIIQGFSRRGEYLQKVPHDGDPPRGGYENMNTRTQRSGREKDLSTGVCSTYEVEQSMRTHMIPRRHGQTVSRAEVHVGSGMGNVTQKINPAKVVRELDAPV